MQWKCLQYLSWIKKWLPMPLYGFKSQLAPDRLLIQLCWPVFFKYMLHQLFEVGRISKGKESSLVLV